MMHKKIWPLIFILFLAARWGLADSYFDKLFSEANSFYENGRYKEAIAGYEKITAMGVKNKDVFYNLGNAYFKDVQLGRAILNYERSLALDRRDEEARENLNTALASAKDKQPFIKKTLIELPIVFLAEKVSFREAAVYTTICFWLLMLALILVIKSDKRRAFFWKLCAGLTVLVLSGIAGLTVSYLSANKSPGAVIMVSETQAKSGPGEQYATGFKLHEGTKVFIDAHKYNWYKVHLANKMTGWVREEVVEKI